MSKYAKEIEVIKEAQEAAAAATAAYLRDFPDQWYPCGFSWVKIRPARGPIVAALKELDMGSKDDYAGGFMVYNPSKNSTQCMDAKEQGSRAFVTVLKKYYPDLKAYAQTRID